MLFLCTETLNELYLNVAIACLPGLGLEAKEPGTRGWPVLAVRAFSHLQAAGAWETSPADSVALCLWVGCVKIHCTSCPFWLPALRDTQFLPRNLLKAFWFCCFVNMKFIPKFGVSHDLRDPASSSPSMHRRENVVLVFHSRACTPWCSQAKHPRTRCHDGHARDKQLQVMLWWVALSTAQTKNQCSETS